MKKNINKLVVFNVNVALLLSLVTIFTLAFPFASITTGTITTNSSGFNVLVGIINDKMYPQIVAIILLTVGILCIFDAIGLLLVKMDAKKVKNIS